MSRKKTPATLVLSDAELTEIYNKANGLDPKRHSPITTERIFNAMRACLKLGAEGSDK